ncbi:MAG: methylated-DNA--[protein]-cysteine S-methyltransferase [Bacteroidota bacterium]
MKNTSTEIAPAGQVCLQTSSPIGVLEITGSTAGIRSVRRVETDSVSAASGLPQDHPVAVCARQLSEYFSGDRREFDLLMDWSGKPVFFRKVWTEMLKIPFGSTASYSDMAEKAGSPKAVRAVGMANRSNPFAIIVPCHRVIARSGALHGYFYGLDIKEQLLRHENPARGQTHKPLK